jgi:uncharacterized membrane protein
MAGLNDLAGGAKLSVPGLDSAVGGSTNKDLMAAARMALSGNWGMAAIGSVLFLALISSFFMFLLSAAIFAGVNSSASSDEFLARMGSVSPFLSLVQLLFAGPITVGFMAFFLGIASEGEAQFDKLFDGFRRFFTSLGVYFFTSLFIALWSLLLVIPGIIAAFRYAMVYFVVADDGECGFFEALGRSRDMMKGNKWKFFCLNLRFVGWAMLASLTCGIGYLWLVPYMQTSFAKFYEDVS